MAKMADNYYLLFQIFKSVDHECDAFFVFVSKGSEVRPKLSGIFLLTLINRAYMYL